jgi:hypothetical protein
MSDFSRGLDEIWKKSNDLDHKEFTMEIIKLHENEVAKMKNFVPIGTEQYGFFFRLLTLPFVILGSAIWCVVFLFSTTTFGRLLIITGEGFLKKKDEQPIATGTDKDEPKPSDENEQGK